MGIIFKFVIHENKRNPFPISKVKTYLKTALRLMNIPLNKKRSRVNLIVFDTQIRKVLPETGKSIEAVHVNSGYCYPMSQENEVNIVIYRRQEFCKVLVHELIHLFNIVPHSESLQTYYGHKFSSVKTTLNVNEAFVEFEALLIHCKVLAHKNDKDLQTTLEEEYSFSAKEVKKILKQQSTDIHRILDDSFEWKENTNAFAYFVLKHILLHTYLNKSVETFVNDLEERVNKARNSVSKKKPYIGLTRNSMHIDI
jgi:hypothetical protein